MKTKMMLMMMASYGCATNGDGVFLQHDYHAREPDNVRTRDSVPVHNHVHVG